MESAQSNQTKYVNHIVKYGCDSDKPRILFDEVESFIYVGDVGMMRRNRNSYVIITESYLLTTNNIHVHILNIIHTHM